MACVEKAVPGRMLIGFGAVILVLAALWIYAPALRGGFVWDDDVYITQNPLVTGPDGFYRIWMTTEARDYYPITLSVFRLEWRCWGERTFGYHLVNLLLHVMNGWLLWLLLARLRIRGGWLAALLFVVHPVNVVSVAWICELKNVLCTMFALVCLLCYGEYERAERPGWYGAAIGAFLLALLSKTAVVMLPVVMLLAPAWWRRGVITRRDVRRTLPFFGLSVMLGLVTVWFQQHRAMQGATELAGGFLERCAAAGWAVWFYLYKAFVPVRLSMVYGPWNLSPGLRLGFLALGMLAVCVWLLWRARRPWARAVLAGVGCYAVMLAPVLGFFDQGFFAYSMVADHWQYVALPALCALVAGGCASLAANRWAVAVAGLLAACLGWQARTRSAMFVSDEAVWRDTVVNSPRSWVAHQNLANDLARRGEDGQALREYLLALDLNPKSGDAHFSLAVVLQRHGKIAEATQQLGAACLFDPSHAGWFDELGSLFAQQDKYDQAVACFSEAVRLEPTASSRYNLGIALAKLGRWEEARVQFTEALRLDPADADIHYALARSLLQVGQPNEAMDNYRAGLRQDPGSAQAAETLSNLLAAGQRP